MLFPFDGSLCDGIQCSDVLDSFLLELALSQGKIVGGVETLEERCSYINSFPDHLGVFALNKTLNDIERKTFEKDYGLDIEDWINKYRNASFDSDDFLFGNLDYEINDLEVQRKVFDYDDFNKKQLLTRNERMADVVAQLLTNSSDKKFFFAFGVAHFLGTGSVIDYLEDRGFNVTRRISS